MKIRVQSIASLGFFRLGTFWPVEGKDVEQADFSEAQWEVLAAEPNLRVSMVKAEVVIDETGLRDRVFAAIADLPAEGFGADGAPLLTALHAALPDLISQITPQLRDDLWAQAKVLPAKTVPGEVVPVAAVPVETVDQTPADAPIPTAEQAPAADVADAPDALPEATAQAPAEAASAEDTDLEPVAPEDRAEDRAEDGAADGAEFPPLGAEPADPVIAINDPITATFAQLTDGDFLSDGRPKVSAIMALLPAGSDTLSAETRDALWADYLAAQAAL